MAPVPLVLARAHAGLRTLSMHHCHVGHRESAFTATLPPLAAGTALAIGRNDVSATVSKSPRA